MAQTYDAVIIGGGHNGLTCGAYLAKAGLRTLVLERRHVLGGAAVSEEIVPGFTFSVFSYVMSLLHPKVMRDLALREHGLEVLPATDLFCPLDDGDSIIFSDDQQKTVREFSRFSKKDAAAYPAFAAHLEEAAAIVRGLLLETPIDPMRRDWRSFKDTARLLWRYRKLGRRFYRIVDLLTMSAYDYLSRWFESDVIKAVFAYYASIGTYAGPKSPGSAYVIMHHLMGEHEGAGGWGFVRGGMGSISQALARSGARHGLETRTGVEVARVLLQGDRASGVVTAGGEEIRARAVACNASCKVLFEQLVPAAALPPEFLDEIRSFRTFSTAFKINAACEAPPRYKAFDQARAGFEYPAYVHIGPDIDYLERAYDDAKHGWYSSQPFVTPVVPTTVDDTIAPAGKHVVHMFGGHAPYELRNAQLGAGARQLRAHRARHDGSLRAGVLEPDHRPAGPRAARHRAHPEPAARPYLPWRAGARSAVLSAAGAGLCRLPHPDQGPLPVRLVRASGRRGERHPRPQRGARDFSRPEAAKGLNRAGDDPGGRAAPCILPRSRVGPTYEGANRKSRRTGRKKRRCSRSPP